MERVARWIERCSHWLKSWCYVLEQGIKLVGPCIGFNLPFSFETWRKSKTKNVFLRLKSRRRFVESSSVTSITNYTQECFAEHNFETEVQRIMVVVFFKINIPSKMMTIIVIFIYSRNFIIKMLFLKVVCNCFLVNRSRQIKQDHKLPGP